MVIRCADHVTPLYPPNLALSSLTGGGRSIDIVRSRAKDTEFTFVVYNGFEVLYFHYREALKQVVRVMVLRMATLPM